MRQIKVKQVDVFTTTPLCGNPVAVVLDAQGLNSEEMRAIAREMNLSETTFVLPPTTPKSDYLLRIFTPRSELPFAGHPTIGTAHAIIEEGQLFKDQLPSLVRQECGIGIVPIGVERKDNGLFFQVTQSEPQWRDADLTRLHAAEMLGCHQDDFVPNLPFEIVSTGVRWLIIPLSSLQTMKALKPNMTLVEETCSAMGAIGATAFSLETERKGHAVHVRSFAPGLGVAEDPVCGTGNGSVAAYIARHSLMPGERFDYLAEQGSEILRPGTVAVRAELGKSGKWIIQVGGQAVTILVGAILL
jgi:PhzF family phenazine biosynthesis protein